MKEGILPPHRSLGCLETKYLEEHFGKLQTNEIIVTEERLEHIKQRHPEDVDLFDSLGEATVSAPDIVLADSKHQGTVFMVKHLPETNLNVIVRVALGTDEKGRKNSVMTFYRLRDKNLKKLKGSNAILFERKSLQ